MRGNGGQVRMEMVPKEPSLEEELFHCLTYLIQQFACREDARIIQTLLDDNSLGFGFVGKQKRIKMIPELTPVHRVLTKKLNK